MFLHKLFISSLLFFSDDGRKSEGESDCGMAGDGLGLGGSVSDDENVANHKFDAGSRISNEDTEVQLSTDNSTIGFSTGESTPQAISDEPFPVGEGD